MFLQIHALTSFHASLLNRDDAGLAKRITFGGVERLRVSSQSQKRHWREWLMHRTDLSSGWRSRYFFPRVILPRLLAAGVEESHAIALIQTFGQALFKKGLDADLMSPTILFGAPEADYFTELILEVAGGDTASAQKRLMETMKDQQANLDALLRQNGQTDPIAGFEGALFGRFVTSDRLARVDAPVHVAHAFTTHAAANEMDFFSAVDDLGGDEPGAAHTNDMDLGAGLFYSYVVVDLPLLVSNLTGCVRQDWRNQDVDGARALVAQLVHAIAEVTPGAKLGATAPYARAECLVLESGTAQPRSLANAFLHPIALGLDDQHPMEQSITALGNQLSALDRMYGATADHRTVSSMHPWPRPQESVIPVPEAIETHLTAMLGAS